MKIDQFLETHPVFRYEEFAEFMTTIGTNRPESWRQLLNYHQKMGNIIHIRKFLYAVKPIFRQEAWVDPYLVASKAAPDSILAYHTALELHAIAYTTFNDFTFLSNRQIQPFTYEAQRFRGVAQPKALLDIGDASFGVETIKRGEMPIRITNLERSIVDVLDRSDLAGGWEEVWRSLDNVTQFNIDVLIKYTLLLKNATIVSKVGFFLEQRPAHFAIDKSKIDKLLPHIPKQPHYMNRHARQGGKYIEKWHLMVPLSIINRTWEEPDVENI